MADIECPSCGTQLRNAQPGPDGHLRCLNCGKRFAVAASGAASSEANAASAAANLPPGRAPAAGHYGLLTIFGGLFLVATFVLMIPAFWIAARGLNDLTSRWDLDDFGVTLYGVSALVGLPLLGISVLSALKTIPVLDGYAVRLAWRLGLRSESPGEAPGSNLPYLLPFSAAGGLFILLPAMLLLQSPSSSKAYDLLPFLLAGPLLLFLGLAMGEVRRFLWRMEQTACVLLRPDETYGPPSEPLLARAVPWLAAAVMPLNLALLFCFLLFAEFANRWEFAMWLAFGAFLIGGPFTLCRVAINARNVLRLWGQAAHRHGVHAVPHKNWPLERMTVNRHSLFLHATFFCCLMILVMFVLPNIDYIVYRRDRLGAILCLFSGCAAVCFALFLAGALGLLAGYARMVRGWAGLVLAGNLAETSKQNPEPALDRVAWLLPSLCAANILGLFLDATGSSFHGLSLFAMGGPAWFAWWLFLLCEELRGLNRSMANLEAACTPRALTADAQPSDD